MLYEWILLNKHYLMTKIQTLSQSVNDLQPSHNIRLNIISLSAAMTHQNFKERLAATGY